MDNSRHRFVNMLKLLVLVFVITHSNGLSIKEYLKKFEKNTVLITKYADEKTSDFVKEYQKFQKSGKESEKLRLLFEELSSLRSKDSKLFTSSIAEMGILDQFFVCTACRVTVSILTAAFRDSSSNSTSDEPDRQKVCSTAFVDICQRLKLQKEKICGDLFDINWPVIDFIMQNVTIDGRAVCSNLPISFCKSNKKESSWSVKIDKNDNNKKMAKDKSPKKGDNDMAILHITDIHYDPLYNPEAAADCEELLCCQGQKTENANKTAGYWSDYGYCDAPLHMITDVLKHIRATHQKIDMIYNTGDIVDHMIWGTTKEKVTQVITKINNLLAEIFPGVPIYSCIGNHDSHPANVFGPLNVPEEISTKWLYELFFNVWSKWLPAETGETIKSGGYYTVSVKAGFRIISLNNNDCNIFNWWIYFNGSIALQQMQWLHDTLLIAEKANESVHILVHIPSGSTDCCSIWGREFDRLVQRFRNTISAIFDGHTHKDEYKVHYTNKSEAVGISFNGGSLTTYPKKNPNYKIYQVTEKKKEVVDFENWICNVTQANDQGPQQSPVWFKLYLFSIDFVVDLSPCGLNRFWERMALFPFLLRKYWCFMFGGFCGVCDNSCLKKTVCSSTQSTKRCKELQGKLETGLKKESSGGGAGTTTESCQGKEDCYDEYDYYMDDGATARNTFQFSTLIALFFVLKFLP